MRQLSLILMLVSNLNRHRQFFVGQQIDVISMKNKARLDPIGGLDRDELHRWPLYYLDDCFRGAQFCFSIPSHGVARTSPTSVVEVHCPSTTETASAAKSAMSG